MNANEQRRYDMFIRVSEFGVENQADFPAGGVGNARFAEIAAVIPIIETHAADQTGGTQNVRMGYFNKGTARENLRAAISEITTTARAMVYDYPGIKEIFRMPRSASDADLLAAANAFAAAMNPYQNAFVEYGLDAGFLTALTDDITAFQTALSAPDSGMGEQVAATAELGAAIQRGMQAVRVLEGVVRNKYRDNVGKLAAWETASHVERAPKSSIPPLKKTPVEK